MKNTWVKINHWSNTNLYQASNGVRTVNVEITNIKDRLGTLKLAECSAIAGRVESYSLSEIKNTIFRALNTESNFIKN